MGDEKSPFRKVSEINTKLIKMKEIYTKKKSTDEKKIKDMTKEEQVKFTQAKEQFFKKELASKKEAFTKKCRKEKETITKKGLAEEAYQERKTKKMCMKTRVASELNNKRTIQYYDFGIKKLKANCKQADAMYQQDRVEFVDSVCKAIRNDIKGAVGKWMNENYKIDIGVKEIKPIVAEEKKAAGNPKA